MKNFKMFLFTAVLFMFLKIPVMAAIPDETIIEITDYIEQEMDKSKIQGISFVLIKDGETVSKETFGYADTKQKIPVTEETLFELGSNSKAFTALGIYFMEEQGMLNLDAKVSDYIPWFQMSYNNKLNDDITLRQCLYHTTGIHENTIGIIKEYKEHELVQTIRSLSGRELVNRPGEVFEYATINYDILGLVIETVSGKPFAEFMQDEIFSRCNLKDTFFRRDYSIPDKLAKGYRVSFTRALEDDAPIYIGNAPAGYAVMNLKDMEHWLKLQGEATSASSEIDSLIKKLLPKLREIDLNIETHSHDVDGYKTVRYGSGWEQAETKPGYFHSGNNPNYSSYQYFDPVSSIAYALLCNAGSDSIEKVGFGILEILEGKEPLKHDDPLIIGDRNFTVFSIILGLLLLFQLVRVVQKAKNISGAFYLTSKNMVVIGAFFVLMVVIGIMLYQLPNILTNGLNWKFIIIWSTRAMPLAVIFLYVDIMLLIINLYLNKTYKAINKQVNAKKKVVNR